MGSSDEGEVPLNDLRYSQVPIKLRLETLNQQNSSSPKATENYNSSSSLTRKAPFNFGQEAELSFDSGSIINLGQAQKNWNLEAGSLTPNPKSTKKLLNQGLQRPMPLNIYNTRRHSMKADQDSDCDNTSFESIHMNEVGANSPNVRRNSTMDLKSFIGINNMGSL